MAATVPFAAVVSATQKNPRCAVIVSLYDARSLAPLSCLFESMVRFEAGMSYALILVLNRTTNLILDLPRHPGMQVLERENTGMNIGAWDHGWRMNPDFDAYLFLQDECLVQRDNWLRAFDQAASQGVALVGESLNTAWDRPWSELRASQGATVMREHQLNNLPANRVDVYLDVMQRAGIDPGPRGRHLRSLVWFARREWLTRINGFPVGADFGQCIGAEIAVSRAVEAAGGVVAQVADKPFSFIRHAEWHQHYVDGVFVHGPAPGQIKKMPRAVFWRKKLGSLWHRLRGLRSH